MNIPAISPLLSGAPAFGPRAPIGAGASPGVDFGAQLATALREVNAAQLNADEGLRAMAAGEGTDIHQTMIGLAEADIALRTMVSVRDRAVEAYQTVMNMSI